MTDETITALVRNSPKLLTLYLTARIDLNIECFIVTLKENFSTRKLFTAGYCYIDEVDRTVTCDFLSELHATLFPPWNFKFNDVHFKLPHS